MALSIFLIQVCTARPPVESHKLDSSIFGVGGNPSISLHPINRRGPSPFESISFPQTKSSDGARLIKSVVERRELPKFAYKALSPKRDSNIGLLKRSIEPLALDRIPTGVVGHQPESSSHKRNLNAGELLLFSIVWFETISSCSCFSGVFIKSQGSGRL
ncbi:hypothetical protein M8J76_009992 [Diaphorina citri]|nr:hypothetical protein M8J76_009992 [Diaphorina citri]